MFVGAAYGNMCAMYYYLIALIFLSAFYCFVCTNLVSDINFLLAHYIWFIRWSVV